MLALLAMLAVGAPQVVNCASQADAQIRAAIFSVDRGARIAIVTGPSMGDAMPAGSIVLVANAPFSEIAAGSVLVAKFNGIPTAHRAVERCGDGWWVRGDASRQINGVTAGNYLGCVTMIFKFPRP